MEKRLNNQKLVEEMVLMVARQTNLEYDVAKGLLEQNNYDYMKVIKESNGIVVTKKDTAHCDTVNQMVYTEIRHLMDDAAKKFRTKQEFEKSRDDYIKSLETR